MVMLHETDENGITYTWEMEIGTCPECGANCSVDSPMTPGAPKRVLCWWCYYSEGYSHFDE